MTTTQSTQINGIDTQAVQQLVEEVGRDATKGMVTFGVQTAWKGGTRGDTRVSSYTMGGQDHPRDFTISVDEPPELLGTDLFPNPQELLFAALNSCMMMGYVTVAAVMGIALDSLEIETSGTLDLRGYLDLDPAVKPGYDAVHYTVRIAGDGTPEQFEQLHQQVIKTSVNRFNIEQPVTVTSDLVVI